MKKVLLLDLAVFLSIIYQTHSQDWTTINSGTTQNLWSIHFPSSQTGYAVGENGTVLKTTDGGSTWNSISTGTNNDFLDCFFTDDNTGYIVGGTNINSPYYPIVMKTTNGGSSWQSQTTPNIYRPSGVHFINSSTGYIVGCFGLILKTTNGGSNWSLQTSNTWFGIFRIYAMSDQIIYLAGDYNTIMKTTNGGSSWQFQIYSGSTDVRDITFIDENVGFAVGLDYSGGYNPGGTFFKNTSNGGANWSNKTSPSTNQLWSIIFNDQNEGWICGDYGKIFKTNNGGANWSTENSGVTSNLRTLAKASLNNIFAVGDGGRILKHETYRTITTNSITSITNTSASTGGEVTDDGGAEVTARGVCWNTTGTPTTADDKTEDGTGTGSFTSEITGLSPGSTYYVRAYATNSVGTSYGDELEFTTNEDIDFGLVAYYPFNGNANDESGNGNNGTVNGAILNDDRHGCLNKAYSFDGIDDYISINNNLVLNIVENGAISVWIKKVEYKTSYCEDIINNNLIFYNYNSLYLSIHASVGLHFRYGGTEQDGNQYLNYQQSDGWMSNTWHHIAVVWERIEGTTFLRMYADNILVDQDLTNLSINLNDVQWNIGKYLHRPDNDWFSGIIDDIRIYNRALSVAEIQELYNQGSECQEAPLPEDLVLWLDGQDVGAKFEVPPTPPESFFDVWFDQTTPQENAEQSDLNRQAIFTVTNGFGGSRPGVQFSHAAGAGGHGWGNDDVMEILFSPEISSGVENELLMSDPAATFTSKNLLVVFKTPALEAMNGRQLLFETGETTSGFNMYLDDGTLLFGMWNRLERKFLRYKPEGAVPLLPETVYLLHLEFDAEKKQFRGILSGDASSPLGFSGITKDPDDLEGKASTGICGEVLGTRFHDFNIRTDNYAYTCTGIFGDILLYNKAFIKSEMDAVYDFLNGRYGQGWIYPDWPIAGEKAPSRWIAYEENLSEPIEPAIATFKPNPFSNVTVMTLNVPSEQNVVIELFDALGRLVQTVYSGEAVAGSMELRIDGTSLPNGVYTVKARGENFHIAANIVVIK